MELFLQTIGAVIFNLVALAVTPPPSVPLPLAQDAPKIRGVESILDSETVCTEPIRRGIPDTLDLVREGGHEWLVKHIRHDLKVCNMAPTEIGTTDEELASLALDNKLATDEPQVHLSMK